MIVQYISDLHLEMEPNRINFDDIIVPVNSTEETSTRILLLVGDICTTQYLDLLRRFLKYCKTFWNIVAYIPGNHEYYGNSILTANGVLEKLCNEESVLFCPKKLISIPNRKKNSSLIIICTTLWSALEKEHEEEITNRLNDYRLIEGFKPQDSNSMHQDMKNFIAISVENCKKLDPSCDILVATHHAPVLQGASFPYHVGNSINSAFCSDCTDVMTNVNYWIFGHTHYNPDPFAIRNTVLHSNQRGYQGSAKNYNSRVFLVF
jgi:predicted phosphohydrolase